MVLSPFIAWLLGMIVGIQAPWWAELIIVAASIVYLNSWHCRRQELGALFTMMVIFCFWAGMFIGDLIAYFAFEGGTLESLALDIVRVIRLIFTPFKFG